jgi:hypothetical protein
LFATLLGLIAHGEDCEDRQPRVPRILQDGYAWTLFAAHTAFPQYQLGPAEPANYVSVNPVRFSSNLTLRRFDIARGRFYEWSVEA